LLPCFFRLFRLLLLLLLLLLLGFFVFVPFPLPFPLELVLLWSSTEASVALSAVRLLLESDPEIALVDDKITEPRWLIELVTAQTTPRGTCLRNLNDRLVVSGHSLKGTQGVNKVMGPRWMRSGQSWSICMI
jgi:hypothetical protein